MTSTLLLILIIALATNCDGRMTDLSFGRLDIYSQRKVKDELIYNAKKTQSMIRCAVHCMVDGDCMAASYYDNEGNCQLSTYKINGSDNQIGLAIESTWTSLSKRLCFDNWKRVGDSCYLFHEELQPYNESKIYCKKKGGKLAEPPTYAEYELLRLYLVHIRLCANYWYGFNDMLEEGRIVWTSSGDVPRYTVWSSYQPCDRPGNNCGYLPAERWYLWCDMICSYKMCAICQQ